MKKIFYTLLITLLLISCSSSDEPIIEDPVYGPTDYFSIKNGNYWIYDVVNSNGTTGRDSLYTANDTLISGNTYKKFKTKNEPSGFYSATFRNNAVRKIEDKIVISGTIDASNGLGGIPVNIDLTLSDFVVFKEHVIADTQLDSKEGNFIQTVQGSPYPLKITYKLSTIAGENLSSYVSDGTTYLNVKKVKIILNLKIDLLVATNPIELTQPILTNQDVVVSEQYYAKNIGVIYVKTTTNYTLESIVATLLPTIPLSNSTTQEEFLDTYLVNP